MQTYITHSHEGETSFSPARPARLGPAPDHTRRPVDFSVRRDLDLEIHGEHFSATVRLTPEDALGLIMRLTYGIREATCRTPTTFVEVTK